MIPSDRFRSPLMTSARIERGVLVGQRRRGDAVAGFFARWGFWNWPFCFLLCRLVLIFPVGVLLVLGLERGRPV